uniref:Uncharacterized protein n=1 Tax=Micrurus lemniscatus lemniscatus TaxID=129467 RepID=A0A2D4HWP3_MICLE
MLSRRWNVWFPSPLKRELPISGGSEGRKEKLLVPGGCREPQKNPVDRDWERGKKVREMDKPWGQLRKMGFVVLGQAFEIGCSPQKIIPGGWVKLWGPGDVSLPS